MFYDKTYEENKNCRDCASLLEGYGISLMDDEKEHKRKYRTLSVKLHPDKNPDNKDADEIYKKFKGCYDDYFVKSNCDKRTRGTKYAVKEYNIEEVIDALAHGTFTLPEFIEEVRYRFPYHNRTYIQYVEQYEKAQNEVFEELKPILIKIFNNAGQDVKKFEEDIKTSDEALKYGSYTSIRNRFKDKTREIFIDEIILASKNYEEAKEKVLVNFNRDLSEGIYNAVQTQSVKNFIPFINKEADELSGSKSVISEKLIDIIKKHYPKNWITNKLSTIQEVLKLTLSRLEREGKISEEKKEDILEEKKRLEKEQKEKQRLEELERKQKEEKQRELEEQQRKFSEALKEKNRLSELERKQKEEKQRLEELEKEQQKQKLLSEKKKLDKEKMLKGLKEFEKKQKDLEEKMKKQEEAGILAEIFYTIENYIKNSKITDMTKLGNETIDHINSKYEKMPKYKNIIDNNRMDIALTIRKFVLSKMEEIKTDIIRDDYSISNRPLFNYKGRNWNSVDEYKKVHGTDDINIARFNKYYQNINLFKDVKINKTYSEIKTCGDVKIESNKMTISPAVIFTNPQPNFIENLPSVSDIKKLFQYINTTDVMDADTLDMFIDGFRDMKKLSVNQVLRNRIKVLDPNEVVSFWKKHLSKNGELNVSTTGLTSTLIDLLCDMIDQIDEMALTEMITNTILCGIQNLSNQVFESKNTYTTSATFYLNGMKIKDTHYCNSLISAILRTVNLLSFAVSMNNDDTDFFKIQKQLEKGIKFYKIVRQAMYYISSEFTVFTYSKTDKYIKDEFPFIKRIPFKLEDWYLNPKVKEKLLELKINEPDTIVENESMDVFNGSVAHFILDQLHLAVNLAYPEKRKDNYDHLLEFIKKGNEDRITGIQMIIRFYLLLVFIARRR